ncbi:MAG: tetratricopeptide repeat protein [Wenzhouxiangellaceae bacterium]
MQFKIVALMLAVLLTGCAAGPQREESPERAQAASTLANARAAAESGEYQYALELLMPLLDTSSDPTVARQAAQLASALDDWPAASSAAERWLELQPDSRQATQIAAIAALRQQHIDRAVELLQTRLADGDSTRDWSTITALLAAAGSAENSTAALERLIDQAEDLEPGFDDYLRSRLAWQLNRQQQAIELAEEALRVQPDYERALWAAHLTQANLQPERALQYYRMAGEFEPDDRVAAIAEVELLRESGRGDEALDVLARLPQDAEILYTRGVLLQDLGRSAAAGATWQRLASLEPERAGGRHAWLTGLLAEILEMGDEAIDWYARVDGELGPRADLRRAVLLAGRDELQAARELLAEVRRRPDPEISEQAWLLEGQILSEAGQDDQALALLTDALTRLPGSSALLYARAMAAVNDDELSLAEQDLRAIIQNDPENAVALNALGYTLSDRTDRQREAMRLIETALEIEPDNPAILDSMGWVLFKLGRADEGLPYLLRAAEAEPHPEIVAHLIETLWTLGRHDDARDWVARTRGEMSGETVFDDTLNRIGLD